MLHWYKWDAPRALTRGSVYNPPSISGQHGAIPQLILQPYNDYKNYNSIDLLDHYATRFDTSSPRNTASRVSTATFPLFA